MVKRQLSQTVLAMVGLLAVALVFTSVNADRGNEPDKVTGVVATTSLHLPVIFDVPLPQLPLRNGGFEEGPAHWAQSTTSGFPIITPSGDLVVDPRNGSWAAWLGGADNDVSLLSQDVTITPDKRTLVLWHWIASRDICGPDEAEILINSTRVWSQELCGANDTNGWRRLTVNLSAFAGQVVKLHFRTETDGSLNSNWFLDDVSLQASAQVQTIEEGGPVGHNAVDSARASNGK